MFIHTKLQNKEYVIEALCRAKFKFPGHQKIHISKSGALSGLMQMKLKTWY
jgi:ribosomal protein L16/L10AE